MIRLDSSSSSAGIESISVLIIAHASSTRSIALSLINIFIEDLIEDTKQGHPHEQNETRCFKSVGMGLFDVRTAQLIYEKALEKGIGQKLNF